jgi:hypothetical protein
MNCNNHDHHKPNGEPCNNGGDHHSCGPQSNNSPESPNPHDMHYHINKYAVRAWLMNAVYLGLHAVQIYLIIKLS